MPKNYWAFKEISALTKRGILSGNSEKLFSPDETISVIDGYVIIIRMLGLEPVAVHRGGYPSGYITVASTSGLTKDIGTNTEMTLGTMFTIYIFIHRQVCFILAYFIFCVITFK